MGGTRLKLFYAYYDFETWAISFTQTYLYFVAGKAVGPFSSDSVTLESGILKHTQSNKDSSTVKL